MSDETRVGRLGSERVSLSKVLLGYLLLLLLRLHGASHTLGVVVALNSLHLVCISKTVILSSPCSGILVQISL